MASNPLLQPSPYQSLDAILPEHAGPALDELLSRAEGVIEETAKKGGAWEEVVYPIACIEEAISRAWSLVSHLHATLNTPAWREAYRQNLHRITLHHTRFWQNEALFRLFASLEPQMQKGPRAHVLSCLLRDFRLGGVALPPEKKARHREISERLADLASQFEEHVVDATDAFRFHAEDRGKLLGLPLDVVEEGALAAQKENLPGVLLTLQMPVYMAVMRFAEDRDLRHAFYRAHCTRASDLGPATLDNTPIIQEILALREEEARLLGYPTFAHLSLASKMAKDPKQVQDFLHTLLQAAKPAAQKEFAELSDFAKTSLGIPDLQAWDVAFAGEKMRQARFSFSEEELRRYFSLDRVLQGSFSLFSKLFGIRIEDQGMAGEHTQRFVFKNGQEGVLLADLFARQQKRGGAWMDGAQTPLPDREEPSVAFLVCNFQKSGGQALLTHDEVETFLHESGHGLHHLLSRAKEPWARGIHGVEWDAVELPSQLMERFAWEYPSLAPLSEGPEGAPLPEELFQKLRQARNFLAGMALVRQLEFSLFDLYLHERFDPKGDVLALRDQVRKEAAVVFPPVFNRDPMSFGHIFAGGYASGYYSYLWAEVLSADAFAAFLDAGVVSGDAGRRFVEEILCRGSERPMEESFVAFRGRMPSVEALLQEKGLLPK